MPTPTEPPKTQQAPSQAAPTAAAKPAAQPAAPGTAAPAPAAKARIAPVDEVKQALVKMEGQFQAVLPTHIAPQKFIRVAQTAVMLRPELATADRRILWGELMKCATDGLVPDGREATINVYHSKGVGVPKYIPMVAGICKKARNSGEISTIDAQVVYENDSYEAWTDEKGAHFKHVRARKDRGAPILTYAYAITKDGGFYFEEIDEIQMAAIERSSRAKDSSPWKGEFKDEMRRKSGLHRLGKYRLPNSADIEQVLHRDDDLYDLPKPGDEPPMAAGSSRPTRLGKIVEAQADHTSEPDTAASAQAPQPGAVPAASFPVKDEGEMVDAEVLDEEVPI